MDVSTTRLFLVLLAFCSGCAERDRPLPLDAAMPVALSVEVLAPDFNAVAVAGRTITIRVQASEPAGRLEGLGFVAEHVDQGVADSDDVVAGAVVAQGRGLFGAVHPGDGSRRPGSGA